VRWSKIKSRNATGGLISISLYSDINDQRILTVNGIRKVFRNAA
jgi:hypothetical protein